MAEWTLRDLEDLYYQAQFQKVATIIEEQIHERDGQTLMLHASVLFEMGESQKASQALTQAATVSSEEPGEHHRYSLARMAYMNDQHRQARTLFSHIYEDASDERMRFKALLGMANSYMQEQNWDHVEYLIEDLQAFSLDRIDDQICLLHLLGAFWCHGKNVYEKAREHYNKALKLAVSQNWNYWVIRSLYGLAKAAKVENKQNELATTLNLLSAFVEGAQASFLSHMIQKEFAGMFQADIDVEFDSANMRLMIKNSWISFSDRPKLYQFLELLHLEGQFVKKRNIAETLWPEESYIPGVHDPRIFDIAKRVRMTMKEHDCAPVTLLSGRQGYKLAVCA